MIITIIGLIIIALVGFYFALDIISFSAAIFLTIIITTFLESAIQGQSIKTTLVKSSRSQYIPVNDAYYLIEGNQITAVFGFIILAKPQDMSALAQLSSFEFEINISSTLTSFLLYYEDNYPSLGNLNRIPYTFINNAEERSQDFKKSLERLMPGLNLEIMPLTSLAEMLGLPEIYLTKGNSSIDTSSDVVVLDELISILSKLKNAFPELISLEDYLTKNKKNFNDSHERLNAIWMMTNFVNTRKQFFQADLVKNYLKLIFDENNLLKTNFDIFAKFKGLLTVFDNQNSLL